MAFIIVFLSVDFGGRSISQTEGHFGAKIGFFHSPVKKSNLLISLPGMTSRGGLDYSQGFR